jgi:hypothetical protein
VRLQASQSVKNVIFAYMSEPIFISVPYKNAEKQVEIQLEVTGYTHRIRVLVDEVPVLFEPDEERQYRAIVPPEHAQAGESLDPVLLQAIAATLEKELS